MLKSNLVRLCTLGTAALLAAGFVGTAAATPIRPAPHIQTIGHHPANCPGIPGGTGLLSDGDFSQEPDPGYTNIVSAKGTVFAPNWVVSKHDVDFNGSPYWGFTWYCSVDLDGLYEVGGIRSGKFATTKGSTYTVTFLLSGNGGSPPTVKTCLLKASGQFTIFSWDTSSNHDIEDGQYSAESWNFQATGSFAALQFVSKDPPKSSRGCVVAGFSVALAG